MSVICEVCTLCGHAWSASLTVCVCAHSEKRGSCVLCAVMFSVCGAFDV